jgi:hypothetical protein
MSFAAPAKPPEVPGFEPLCVLALETVADVSCVDRVVDGVLRRATAAVAGEPDLRHGCVEPSASQARDRDLGSAARGRHPSRGSRPERALLT